MKYTLIISDLHLSEAKPRTVKLLQQFIAKWAAKADALYILGDLFELWAGDDDRTEFNTKIIELLKDLSSQNVKVYLMPGNRDFILGETFAKECNCSLLPDPYKTTIYGVPLLLTHGDILCTKDRAAVLFRLLTNNSICKKLLLMLQRI